MSSDSPTCPSCGARVSPDSNRCTLCGTPLDRDSEVDSTSDGSASSSSSEVNTTAETGEESVRLSDPDGEGTDETDAPPVYCNQCGWENPGGARYCSRCGYELQDLSDAGTPTGTRPVAANLPVGSDDSTEGDASTETESTETDEEKVMGRKIALVVGVAVAVVVGFFLITHWSQNQSWGGGDAAPGASPGSEQSAPPGRAERSGGGAANAPSDLQSLVEQEGETLTGDVATEVDSLRSVVEEAGGADQQRVRAELVQVLTGAGAPGRAALEQRKLADATNTGQDRRRTADLLYRWMRDVQGQGDRQKVFDVARHVAEAYEAVAEQEPQDLDARTRMGEAYLLTNNPMQGIRAINAVLEEDSTFVPARFQKGLALLQINRLDEALQEFRSVTRHADPGAPFYSRAQQAIQVIEEQAENGTRGAGAQAGARDDN